MRDKVLVTIKQSGKICDYLMSAEEASIVEGILEGDTAAGYRSVEIIPISSLSIATVREVIKEWTA